MRQTALGIQTAEDQYNLHPSIMQIQLGCGAYYERRKISMARECCFLNKRIEIVCHKEVSFQMSVAFIQTGFPVLQKYDGISGTQRRLKKPFSCCFVDVFSDTEDRLFLNT